MKHCEPHRRLLYCLISFFGILEADLRQGYSYKASEINHNRVTYERDSNMGKIYDFILNLKILQFI